MNDPQFPTGKPAEWSLIEGWSAPHRILLISHTRNRARITQIDNEIAGLQDEIVQARKQRDQMEKSAIEVVDFIAASKFTPPEGWDIYGEPIPKP